jgi:DNA-binding winged helix-turn-helix (wHTH) protein
LRNKLNPPNDTTKVEWITTVRGKGYMLASNVTVVRRDDPPPEQGP